ncbi:hypothetical protein [Pleionea mediterranea]|uniref:Uncharacterized protein n=1 Tax=Pleionea mediterranea TaxID=523701 RepID=A0A316F620_9GAMM|nr:hypothetical protein [Pleionea mediterranea]PWK40565.1 hypothetical protein C8D97_1262 [Pleionea mediterranea]
MSEQSREKWSSLNKKLKKLIFLKLDIYGNVLKDYYLNGDISKIRNAEGLPSKLLFEYWLGSNHSEEHLKELYQEYLSSTVLSKDLQTTVHNFEKYSQFARYVDKSRKDTISPDGSAFFSGLEEKLCRVLLPQSLDDSTWVIGNRKPGRKSAMRTFEIIMSQLIELIYTNKENLIEHNILFNRMKYFESVLREGYYLIPNIWGYFVRRVYSILENKQEFHTLQVKLAENIENIFSQDDLPEKIKIDIQKARDGEWDD